MYRLALPALASLALAAAARAVESEDLRPGLVASYRDPGGAELHRLDPTPAVAWKAGESAHPRLSAAAGSAARWDGYLNVLRPGDYRFTAAVRGKLALTLRGKPVPLGEPLALASGVHPITVEYTRPDGDARLELFWSSPFLRREPLPFDALGHLPADEPKALHDDARREYGRFLAEERACLACHKPAGGKPAPAPRAAPNLAGVGGRVYAGWLDAWLADPKKLRPATSMPKLFADDPAGRAERYAVVRFLVAQGGPLAYDAAPDAPRPAAPDGSPPLKQVARFIASKFKPSELEKNAARGRELFTTAGCAACHANTTLPKAGDAVDPDDPRAARVGVFYGLGAETGERANYPLGAVGGKTRVDKLAAFLADPLAVNPSGRMPHMGLAGNEANELAAFLHKTARAGAPHPDLPPAPDGRDDAAWVGEGRRLYAAKGCVNCHALPGVKEQPRGPVAGAGGCLADRPPAAAPDYGFAKAERDALAAYFANAAKEAGTPAPAHAARTALKRFNCLNCHQRDGEGGLTVALVEQMRALEKAENADAVGPPVLTGVGHKLRTPWLHEVLAGTGRSRPWMGLRMPRYGPANVGTLADALTRLEGATPDDPEPAVEVTPAAVAAGRKLVGKAGFGCASCHDVAGVANSGTRGPDLATTTTRVRYDWYRRWLEQPQRMVPGTRMPQVFTEGKSLLADVLTGHADRQADAMWAYCSLGPTMPLPEGLEPPKGNVLTVADRPVMLRTFLPDVGSARGVAVGYPGGVSAAFDAAAGRLAYAWGGNFLDVSPVWDNRGGNPAKPLGPRFWSAPPGPPWALTTGDDPPEFAARAKEPAFGARPPEGTVYAGPPAVHFAGLSVDATGAPTFRYRVALAPGAGTGQELTIEEKPAGLRGDVAPGLARQFTVRRPAGLSAWFAAAETAGEAKAFDAAGGPVAVPSGGWVPPAARWLLLPQDGGRAVALGLPDGTRWRLAARPGGGSTAVLHLPAPAAAATTGLTVAVWGLFRADPELVKGLPAGGRGASAP